MISKGQIDYIANFLGRKQDDIPDKVRLGAVARTGFIMRGKMGLNPKDKYIYLLKFAKEFEISEENLPILEWYYDNSNNIKQYHDEKDSAEIEGLIKKIGLGFILS